MAILSPARSNIALIPGLELFSRGKVRDTYVLPEDRLLPVATNGISIFDFVLNALVPEKGMILNAMNHFWVHYLKDFGFETHFVAGGVGIDSYLPESLRGDAYLQSRAIVVRHLSMVPVEFIARAVLTGSAVKSYKHNLEVCGHKLQSGLQDGDALACFLDTPTTKAEVGHDENLSALDVRQKYPGQTYTLLQVFQIASQYAEQRGIKLADTKLEFGLGGTIGDEILTPDSSRFWEYSTWLDGRKPLRDRKAPPPYDKQLVRTWGIEQGINKLDPVNSDHVAQVHSLKVPQELIERTTQVYRYIFWRLTGMTIEQYLQSEMGVRVPDRKGKSIAIICGSKSDVSAVEAVQNRELFKMTDFVRVDTHVISCHRNPEEIRDFAKEKCSGLDAIICVGSKAFALPGVLDAHLHAAGIPVPVIGVALGESGSLALEAAKLSIEELPGQPVLMDEITGKCWVGSEGLVDAMMRMARGELPPPKPRADKSVEMNVLK